jgi:hypothetical protein
MRSRAGKTASCLAEAGSGGKPGEGHKKAKIVLIPGQDLRLAHRGQGFVVDFRGAVRRRYSQPFRLWISALTPNCVRASIAS